MVNLVMMDKQDLQEQLVLQDPEDFLVYQDFLELKDTEVSLVWMERRENKDPEERKELWEFQDLPVPKDQWAQQVLEEREDVKVPLVHLDYEESME